MTAARFLSIKNAEDFNDLALETFRHQYLNNPVYGEYCKMLNTDPAIVINFRQIPFLPISFFKSHPVITQGLKPEKIFSSSGTTGPDASSHMVASLKKYEQSFINGFNLFYGAPTSYCIVGLLPSYSEREDASLAYMVSRLAILSQCPDSGFYLGDDSRLIELLSTPRKDGRKILLLGVTFALLDLAEKHGISLKNSIVMETGGMKGRRKEMIRQEVHKVLKDAFEVTEVHSEYGMTELLSQAYSKGNGIFNSPPWMKVITREIEDPLGLQEAGRTGGVNIIDLANTDSCSFIATQDLGRVYEDESFEILGRFDHADARGCNLMLS